MGELDFEQDLENDIKGNGNEKGSDSQYHPSPRIGQTEKKEYQEKGTDEKSKKG